MSKRRSAGSASAADPLFQTALSFHENGELQRAEHLYRELLRQRPEHSDALNMLGVIACQSGHFAAGADLIRQAIAVTPKNADYHNNLGMALLQSGDAGSAIASFESAITARPGFAEAQCNLANALRQNNDFERAEKHYRRAIKAAPDYFDALNNLGNLLRQRGANAEAAQLLRRAVRANPSFAPAQLNLGLALQAEAHYEEAITVFRSALALQPDEPTVLEALGNTSSQIGALDEAAAAYAAALEAGGASLSLLNALGLARYAQNRVDEARKCLEQALELAPDDARTLNHLGMVASAAADKSTARECFNQALNLQPYLGSAWVNLLELRPDDEERGEIKQRLERACSKAEPDQIGVEMEFARGRINDAAGDHEQAFRAFSRANAMRRSRIRFDGRQQSQYIEAVQSVFTAEMMRAAAADGSDSEVPVFIVGMPRSGTSLVEQIIASHEAVHGAGELTWFPQHMLALNRRLNVKNAFPLCVPGNERAICAAGREYLSELTARAPSATRISDKMPYNFLYLGVIAMMFPRARVIHCQRDPMATCFSIFSHDLAGNHPYSYDLDELGQAYCGYQQLMAHWRESLPLTLLDVHYADLISDVEATSRAMIDFLGLPWDPNCLEYHRNERAVTTASRWQVRERIYTTSDDHWRHYAPYLEPLAEALEKYGAVAP